MISRKSIKSLTFASLLLAVAVLALGPLLHAQAVSIASVTGRITDPQGAVITGAHVKLVAAATGRVHDMVTNQDGIYTAPNLPVGAYRLEATAQGFQTYLQKGIILQVNDKAQINVTLSVGAVTDTVEVEANASMVQTQQSSVSQVIDGRRIADLPLNGRDATQLITISGAAVNHADGTNTGSKSFFSSQSIAIAGGAGNQTNYLLDGGDNNDSFTNVNMPFPFPDALAEFSVETNSLPARNGLHPGGLVNVVTRSGSNQWHGNLFEFIRNGDVNALNYFSTKADSLKRNQFGGTIGGKVIADKLFFFGGFQQSNIRQDPTNNTAFVPTAAALAGDFTALDNGTCSTRGLKDPVTGAKLTPSQIAHFDTSRYDKAALALVKYLPVTSDPCGKVTWGTPVHSNEQQYVGRVDWNINAKHTVFGRYFYDNYDLLAFFDPKDILVTANSGNAERAQSITLGDTYVLSPSTVNSFHFTFSRRRDNRGPNQAGINAAALGVANVYQGTTNFLQLSVSNGGFNVGSGSGALGSFNINSWQEADDVDMSHGKHQIAFGVDFIKTQDNQNNHFEDNGSFQFSGLYSNDPLLDFLTGKMNKYEQSLPQQNAIRQTVIGLYAQDTIHATPKLVVNAGLRWEPMLFPYDYFKRGSTFSRSAFDAGQVSTVFTNAPPGSQFYGDPGVTKSFTANKLTNFSPRLGIVYNPDGEGKTTFRVGGGILFDSVGTFITYRVIANNLPYGATITNASGPYQLSNPWGNVPGGNPFPLPYPPAKTTLFPTAAAQVLVPQHIKPTLMQQWNAGMQHQFGKDWIFSLTYLGNHTNHLWLGNETNPAVYIPGMCGTAPCSSTSNTQSRRVLSLANPNYGKYYSNQIIANDGNNASYNGLLTSLEHRFAHNYTVLANYTWSKCRAVGAVNTLATAGAIQDPNNPKGDYGPCTYDSPNIFNLSVIATSHVGNRGLLTHLLSNWQIAPLFRFTSGLPVNPQTGQDRSLSGIGLDRPNLTGSNIYTGAAHTRSLFQYVNKAAYASNATGHFGNAGHFSLRGPHYVDVDAAISRDFNLYERITLKARVEAFNLFNHPNFLGPNASFASSSFGQITSASDPRILQAAVKLSF
ncbi:MAG: carboxypeptidase regulatory-like domain-containing protein [Edaphobacter sp.]